MVTTARVEQETLETVNLGQHFQIGPSGLIIIGKPSFADFDALGETLRTLDRSLQFTVGDFFTEVEKRFGEKSGLSERDQTASQILDHTGWSEATLKAYRWTSERIAPERRRMDALTYSHHQAVAALPPKEQKKWLDRAAEGEEQQGTQKPWPVSRLKQEIKSGGNLEVLAHYILVRCKSDADREKLSKELESRGYTCKATERRGERKEPM
jgi:hypothetical protein